MNRLCVVNTFLLLLAIWIPGCVQTESTPFLTQTSIQAATDTYPGSISYRSINKTDYSPYTLGTRDSVVYFKISENSLYIIDLYSGEENQITSEIDYVSYWPGIISPDGSTLVYQLTQENGIKIASLGDGLLKSIPDPKGDLRISYWLDNNHLILDNIRQVDGIVFKIPSLFLYSFDTGIFSEFIPESYPSIRDCCDRSGTYWATDSLLILNPDLNNLVYLARTEDGLSLVLWRIDENEEIATIHSIDSRSTPWWSPDGSRILTSIYLGNEVGSDLFTVDTNGDTKRLTYFTSNFVANQINYAWSPSGNRIAFLLKNREQEDEIPEGNWYLAVLDVITEQTTIFEMAGITDLSKPVWSHNEQYIAIKAYDSNYNTNAYVVDLNEATAFQIAQDAEVVGWNSYQEK